MNVKGCDFMCSGIICIIVGIFILIISKIFKRVSNKKNGKENDILVKYNSKKSKELIIFSSKGSYIIAIAFIIFGIYAIITTVINNNNNSNNNCCTCLDCIYCDICCDCNNPYLNK